MALSFRRPKIGTDPEAIGGFARAAEEAGYDHVLVFDHVLGAAPREGWRGYTYPDPFHEPLVLFGHLAAVTRRVELALGG